jgi:uncharacterized membrane protein YqjE
VSDKDTPQINARVYVVDPFLVKCAYVLWFLCALCILTSVVLVFYRPAYRLAAVTAIFAIVFYKWGRNCYFNLRHDERNDSLA